MLERCPILADPCREELDANFERHRDTDSLALDEPSQRRNRRIRGSEIERLDVVRLYESAFVPGAAEVIHRDVEMREPEELRLATAV